MGRKEKTKQRNGKQKLKNKKADIKTSYYQSLY
jgi:hypothetical protein